MERVRSAPEGKGHPISVQAPDFVAGPPFFSASEATRYRLNPGTRFLLKVGGEDFSSVGLDDALYRSWRKKQDRFLRWTRDERMFNEGDVTYNVALYEKFYKDRPRLSGRVLDIGGGWGLFRKWWSRKEPEACFVVHDPGVGRFIVRPPAALERHYGDGLAKSAWFVEGVGEHLPYQDEKYDVVLIAATLDHCADPGKVLQESMRVLKTGGKLLIFERCDASGGRVGATKTEFLARILKTALNPRRLRRAIRVRLFHRGDPHLHHFSRDSLRSMVVATGFRPVWENPVDADDGVYAFTGVKGSSKEIPHRKSAILSRQWS